MAPSSTDPRAWDRYVTSARSIAQAQERLEEAVRSGVDTSAMLRLQETRSS